MTATRETRTIRPFRTLFDASHTSFELCRCSECDQLYLKQFHEIVDWVGGKDDVWVTWMPLLDEEQAEVQAICRGGRGGLWNRLADFMHRRERLVWHPDGDLYWTGHPSAGDLMPPG